MDKVKEIMVAGLDKKSSDYTFSSYIEFFHKHIKSFRLKNKKESKIAKKIEWLLKLK